MHKTNIFMDLGIHGNATEYEIGVNPFFQKKQTTCLLFATADQNQAKLDLCFGSSTNLMLLFLTPNHCQRQVGK